MEDIRIAFPSSQSKIFHIYELCMLQTGLRSWIDTCPLENLNIFTFFCTAGYIAVPCLQQVVCVCVLLHTLLSCTSIKSRWFPENHDTTNAPIWPYTPKSDFFIIFFINLLGWCFSYSINVSQILSYRYFLTYCYKQTLLKVSYSQIEYSIYDISSEVRNNSSIDTRMKMCKYLHSFDGHKVKSIQL